MKEFGQGTTGVVALTKSSRLARVSERKVKANRENAKKSTGPKTTRGKAFIRTNALKHGLFANQVTDFEALSENPQEYQNLVNGLCDQFRPVGRAEEIEVERISLCCWRLKRAWRYENAVTLAARRDFVRRELSEQEEYCKERDKEEAAAILELRCAQREIQETGEVSQELKQRMFSLMPRFEEFWSALESGTQERMERSGMWKLFRGLKLEDQARARNVFTVSDAIACLEQVGKQRWINVQEVAIGQHAIPNQEALDRILRYEAAIERNLNRAYDRLERLQRRRVGEFLPRSSYRTRQGK